ncbi:hypothetical protein [Fodinicola acaciae]|uniref:hypothetical protein n=1 Tax=Fodinicola acaciae TaxID=2681555 RepID=UPI0013D21A1F|nr:hypothetical protein [Fodinicola acaciae]
MRLTLVRTRRDLADFIAFPASLYGRDPRYVPAIRQQIRRWHREHVQLALLRDGSGEVVARTTLHTDAGFDRKLGRKLQLFGLTEFVDDDTVAKALFDEIADAGRQKYASAIFGPVSLLPNQSGGVITSGFESRGFVDSAWNRPHYPAAYAANGFHQRFRSDTWICDDLQRDERAVEDVFAFDDNRIAAEQLKIHRGNKKKLATQLPILRQLLNASFAQLGYYTDISAEQLAAQTDGLAFLIDESLLLYLTKAGRPIAFVLCIPDISEFVAGVDGNLDLPHQLRLLVRGRGKDAILIVKGTIPSEQGKGYLRLLSRELLRNLRSGGYHTLRSTYVERSNPASTAQYRAMRGRPLHGYTFYEREI